MARHQVVLVAGALVLASLVGGLASTTYLLMRNHELLVVAEQRLAIISDELTDRAVDAVLSDDLQDAYDAIDIAERAGRGLTLFRL